MGDAVDAWEDGAQLDPSLRGKVVFDAFYRTAAALLRDGVSVIAKASSRRGLDEARLRPLVGMARAAQVHCLVPVDVAAERFLSREPTRRRRSSLGEIPAQMQRGAFDWSPFEPLEPGVPRLAVDTSDGYRPGVDEIIRLCRAAGR
jgi:hypothetical protein